MKRTAARRAASASQGSVRIEEGSLALRAGREVFGVDPAQLPLHRALKRRYDPAGVLNRGRFVGEALGAGFDVLLATKRALDPTGILNPGKLGLPSPFGAPAWP